MGVEKIAAAYLWRRRSREGAGCVCDGGRVVRRMARVRDEGCGRGRLMDRPAVTPVSLADESRGGVGAGHRLALAATPRHRR